jgi:ERF superfamily
MTTTLKTNGRAPRVAATPVSRDGLPAALLAFHAEAPKLTRNAPGQIGSRTYNYTTLDNLLDDVEPLLLKHELLFTVRVTIHEGQPAALYRMEHVPSGEAEEWTGPLPCAEPGAQALGSAITYMRRYTLQAYLNLAAEDDDGAGASQNGGQNAHQNDHQNAQPSAAAPKPSERVITADQREKLIKPRAAKAGLSDGELANVMLVAAGDEPRVWRSEDHATQTRDRLLDRLPMRLKDAVLDGIDAAGEAKR